MSETNKRTYNEKDQERARNAKLAEIKQLLAKAETNDLDARYRIGIVVNDVKINRKKYGDGAVNHVADELSIERTSLYAYAKVVQLWPEKEFEKLCRRKNTAGLPITFSHLIELTKRGLMKNEPKREKLLDKVFSKSLSVRALRDEIGGGMERPKQDAIATMRSSWMTTISDIKEQPSTKELIERIVTEKTKIDAIRAAAEEAVKALEVEQQRVEHELAATVVQTPQLPARKNGKIGVVL